MRLPTRHLAPLTLLLASSLFAADAPPTTAPTIPPLSGKLGAPIQLFNGKDLDGWTWVTNPPTDGSEPLPLSAHWSVVDGAIHLKDKSGIPHFAPGYLREDTSYTNFVLTLEQRHLTKGGGGILIGITGPDKVWPKTFQIQGQSGRVGDFVNQGNFKMTADPAKTKTAKNGDIQTAMIGPNSEKPLGVWDKIEITVDNGTLWVKVNGVLQNLATNAEPLPGTIGFQAEGASQEFRNIELRPIEPK